MDITDNDNAQVTEKPEEMMDTMNTMDSPQEQPEKVKDKSINRNNRYNLQKFDEHFFRIWEENYNINVANNFFGNWLKYDNFVNFQWKKFQNKPLVMVFAGPSLDKNLNLLKDIKDKIVIMCVDVVVFKILEAGMTPDIVVNIDPQNIVRFWDGWNGEGSIFIAPVTTNPENLKEWKGRRHLYNTVDYNYKDKYEALKKLTKSCKNFGNLANAGFIGATMLQIVKDLFPRPNPCIIIGGDFSFPENKAYCSGFLDRRYPGEGREHEKNMEFKKELSIHQIWTSRQLHLYMQIFSTIAKNYNIKITNCTEGGILAETNEIKNERLCDVIDKITGKTH